MHLAEFLKLRPVPAAGVALSVTGRCPLGCAHCSTDATPRSPQAPRSALLAFTASFARAPHPPSVALLTGGEPLLRPALVAELAARCRAAGTAVMLLTGLPFARRGPVPPPRVAAALAAVNHVSVSLDPFHELRVPRAAVFAVLHRVLDAGKDASLHLLSAGPHDPYPDTVAAAVRREFGDRVPMLVGRLAPVGRARGAGPAAGRTQDGAQPVAGPCAVAAWPTVGPDGTIRACSNQDVVDGRSAAPHLRLGTAGEDDWATVRERTLASPLLRVVRTLGAGSCARCQALRGAPDPTTTARSAALQAPVAHLQSHAGALGFARRYGSPRHAPLTLLGAPRNTTPPTAPRDRATTASPTTTPEPTTTASPTPLRDRDAEAPTTAPQARDADATSTAAPQGLTQAGPPPTTPQNGAPTTAPQDAATVAVRSAAHPVPDTERASCGGG